jgi:ABC-type amino acid transport substrate-binding protein
MRALVLLFALLFSPTLFAQTAPEPSPAPIPTMKVGVFDRPPLAIKDEDGHWSGLGVDLWEKIARNLSIPFEYVEIPFEQVVPLLVEGRVDIVVGEVGVSAEREQLIDFTQPFLITPTAVALSKKAQRPEWVAVLQQLDRHGVWNVILVMLLTLLVFSLALWYFERRVQKGHFGGKPIHGLGSAIWFSAVTMTTVGYGDKTPQTPAGRVLAFLWMFFGLLIVSAFTGAVASSLTISGIQANVTRVTDLVRFQNGVLEGSIGSEILQGLGVPAKRFETPQDGLRALQAGQITAFVSNDATLRYLNDRQFGSQFDVIPLPSTHINFAMAVRPGLPLLQKINVDLIRITTRAKWQQEMNTWLGSTPAK